MIFKKLTPSTGIINEKDRELLEFCKPYYLAVAVRMYSDEVPVSKGWQKGRDCESSIYTEPLPGKNGDWPDGWPAIWRILYRMGYIEGGGNQNQHQIYVQVGKKDYDFTRAVYKQIDGEWWYHLHPSVVADIAKKYNV